MAERSQLEMGGGEAMLVRRAQAGDRAAFDQLAAQYRAVLLALAFLRTGQLEDAQDLTQEALTQAWRRLPALLHPASFRPWLKTITLNACQSWRRRPRLPVSSLDARPCHRL